MEDHKLKPLTDYEREFAAENHNLVYSFLRRYGYDLEIYYDVVIFGYLKAVQVYNRRTDLQNKYDFPFISWQYMRSAIGNHLRIDRAKKRKAAEPVASLDDKSLKAENLCDDSAVKSAESEVLGNEIMMELLNSLSDRQRKIAELKLNGYSSREIYQALDIRQSTYYVEIKRIRSVLTEMIG